MSKFRRFTMPILPEALFRRNSSTVQLLPSTLSSEAEEDQTSGLHVLSDPEPDYDEKSEYPLLEEHNDWQIQVEKRRENTVPKLGYRINGDTERERKPSMQPKVHSNCNTKWGQKSSTQTEVQLNHNKTWGGKRTSQTDILLTDNKNLVEKTMFEENKKLEIAKKQDSGQYTDTDSSDSNISSNSESNRRFSSKNRSDNKTNYWIDFKKREKQNATKSFSKQPIREKSKRKRKERKISKKYDATKYVNTDSVENWTLRRKHEKEKEVVLQITVEDLKVLVQEQVSTAMESAGGSYQNTDRRKSIPCLSPERLSTDTETMNSEQPRSSNNSTDELLQNTSSKRRLSMPFDNGNKSKRDKYKKEHPSEMFKRKNFNRRQSVNFPLDHREFTTPGTNLKGGNLLVENTARNYLEVPCEVETDGSVSEIVSVDVLRQQLQNNFMHEKIQDLENRIASISSHSNGTGPCLASCRSHSIHQDSSFGQIPTISQSLKAPNEVGFDKINGNQIYGYPLHMTETTVQSMPPSTSFSIPRATTSLSLNNHAHLPPPIAHLPGAGNNSQTPRADLTQSVSTEQPLRTLANLVASQIQPEAGQTKEDGSTVKNTVAEEINKKEDVGCIKILVIIVNLIMVLTGIGVLALGVWIMSDSNSQLYTAVTKQATDDQSFKYFIYGLCLIGVSAVIVWFCGCFGSVRISKYILKLFIAGLTISILVQFCLLGVVFATKGQTTSIPVLSAVAGEIEVNLLKHMEYSVTELYLEGSLVKKAWDILQVEPKIKMPDTCCVLKEKNFTNPEPTNRLLCQAMIPGFWHELGCFEIIKQWFNESSVMILGVSATFIFTEVLCLVCGITMLKRVQHPDKKKDERQ